MDNNIDPHLYADSMKAALGVDFLTSGEELNCTQLLSITLTFGAGKLIRETKQFLKETGF